MALHSATASLRPKAPFDFARSSAFLEGFSPTSGEQRCEPTAITKALRVGRQTVAFRVKSTGTVDAPSLEVELFSAAPLGPAVIAECERRVAQFLSIDDELAPFYALAQGDPVLARAVEGLRGLHQVRFLTLAEIAVWAVLSQRTPRSQARAMKRTLSEALTEPLEVDGATWWAFLSVDDLVAAGPARLQELLGHERKARAAWAVVEALRGADERFLREGPLAEVEAWLKDIDGIGEWSSAFILFRGLGRCEHMPATDLFLEVAREKYGAGFSKHQFLERVARYGAWCGYWSLYLWGQRMNEGQKGPPRRPVRRGR